MQHPHQQQQQQQQAQMQAQMQAQAQMQMQMQQQQQHLQQQQPSHLLPTRPPLPMQPHPQPTALPHPPHPSSSSSMTLPKQQISSVLNSMTGGGRQHFQNMSDAKHRDGYDLANLHAMNVRYLQQVASQRGMQHHPNRRPDLPPPSAALFSAKM